MIQNGGMEEYKNRSDLPFVVAPDLVQGKNIPNAIKGILIGGWHLSVMKSIIVQSVKDNVLLEH